MFLAVVVVMPVTEGVFWRDVNPSVAAATVVDGVDVRAHQWYAIPRARTRRGRR